MLKLFITSNQESQATFLGVKFEIALISKTNGELGRIKIYAGNLADLFSEEFCKKTFYDLVESADFGYSPITGLFKIEE